MQFPYPFQGFQKKGALLQASIKNFFIIKLLSVKDFSSIDLKSYKFFNDAIANFLSQYSFNNIFLFFLIAGFFFQLLQAFALYINKLMSRYIDARCLSEVTSLIH